MPVIYKCLSLMLPKVENSFVDILSQVLISHETLSSNINWPNNKIST